jgi:hypothetical protein
MAGPASSKGLMILQAHWTGRRIGTHRTHQSTSAWRIWRWAERHESNPHALMAPEVSGSNHRLCTIARGPWTYATPSGRRFWLRWCFRTHREVLNHTFTYYWPEHLASQFIHRTRHLQCADRSCGGHRSQRHILHCDQCRFLMFLRPDCQSH